MIIHISTDVYFDLDCLSGVLHNLASSLVLGSTVSASLSVLVGDSEHQKLAYLFIFGQRLDLRYFTWTLFHFCAYRKPNNHRHHYLNLKYHRTSLVFIYLACTVHVAFTHTRCETGTLEAICSYFLFLEVGAWVKSSVVILRREMRSVCSVILPVFI